MSDDIIFGFGATPIWQANTGLRCAHCLQAYFPDTADPCLGELGGVVGACCGHGRPEEAYVTVILEGSWSPGMNPWDFTDAQKRTLYGEEALRWFERLGRGPNRGEDGA
jgi:hypothetical protein